MSGGEDKMFPEFWTCSRNIDKLAAKDFIIFWRIKDYQKKGYPYLNFKLIVVFPLICLLMKSFLDFSVLLKKSCSKNIETNIFVS